MAVFALLCVSAFLPPAAQAHEDLLARIKVLTEQMSTNGESAELLFQRAEAFRYHQNWEAALADYTAAGKLMTNSEAADFGRAQALTGWGKLAESRVLLDQLLQRNPTNAPALLARAHVLARLGQAAPAIADYSRAFTNLANPRIEDYLERARLQAATPDVAAAVKGLDEALARVGWSVLLESTAVEYELARGNSDGAVTRVETIIARANRPENWLVWKGEILQKAGRPAEARDAFQAALKAIGALPPRLAAAGQMVALRAKIEAALASISPGGETNRASPGP